jgi:hypothetical protein
MPLLFIEELSQTLWRGWPEVSPFAAPARGTEHLLLEEGDLLIEVERVELIVAQQRRGREQAIRGRVKQRSEFLRDETLRMVDASAVRTRSKLLIHAAH